MRDFKDSSLLIKEVLGRHKDLKWEPFDVEEKGQFNLYVSGVYIAYIYNVALGQKDVFYIGSSFAIYGRLSGWHFASKMLIASKETEMPLFIEYARCCDYIQKEKILISELDPMANSVYAKSKGAKNTHFWDTVRRVSLSRIKDLKNIINQQKQ